MRRPAFPLLIFALLVAGFWTWGYGDRHWSYFGVAGLCFAGSIVATYYLLWGLSMASVLVRALIALVPVGFFTLGLILVVLRLDLEESRIAQALIAAVVVAGGWVVAYLTGEWRRVGIEQERRRDVVRAVITELELIADHGKRADWDVAIKRAKDDFRKHAKHDVFIFYGHQFITLKRLVAQIEVLRWSQIRAVMDVFQALDRLERMETKMDSDAFRALPKQRREDGLVRYLTLHSQIPKLAKAALEKLRNEGPFHGWFRDVR